MAEEERRWRQRHAHESNVTPYGTFGTATYYESTQQWSFLRSDSTEQDILDQGTDGGRDTASLLRILSQPVAVAVSSCHSDATRQSAADSTLYSQYSELAAASSTIQGILQSEIDDSSTTTVGNALSFGHAVWLGVDGTESGNAKLPIYAYVDGPGKDLLRLSCIGRQSFDYTSKHGISSSVDIPSLLGDLHTTWNGNLPIQQVVCSRSDLEGRSGTFLAVREASQTVIFEPLLHTDAFTNISSTGRPSLDLNQLLSLPRTHTGGRDHADVSFHPHTQRKLAIVDVEGNWSIWLIKGRRTRTARILYKIVLQVSNKIFSWEHKTRPEGIEPYFDGWHKVLWISNDGEDVNRILVCNRQDGKLFDVKATNKDEVCSVDVRLDTRKEDAYILDVKPGLTPNLCFILTTSRLLLFDFAQKEWKDRGAVHGPALLCAWQHFQKTSDLSLKMATLELQGGMLVTLYSGDSTIVRLSLFHFHYMNGKLSVTVDDPSMFKLPKGLPASPIASLSLATLEISHYEHLTEGQQPFLVQIIIQYDDLSIFTVTVELHRRDLPPADKRSLVLRLPPNHNKQRKSQRYVDETDDEDELAGFIVDGDEIEESEYGEDSVDLEQDTSSSAAKSSKLHDGVSKLLCEIVGGKFPADTMKKVLDALSDGPSTARCDVPKAIEAFDRALQDPSASDGIPQAQLLADLFNKDTRIEDIEIDSATLDRALHMISSAVQGRIQMSNLDKHRSQSLMQTYETFFEDYVNSLNPAVPDRFRVQRERQIRDIALDQYLSSRTVRALPVPDSGPTTDNETLPRPFTFPDSDPMILSDPIIQQQDLPAQRNPAQISASQPTPRPSSSQTSPTHPRPSRLLSEAISRLSTYTTISKPPLPPQPIQTPPSQDDAATAIDTDSSIPNNNNNNNNNSISSLLSHLPDSAAADPNVYDWQAIDLRLSATTDQKASAKSKPDRRAEKIARARRRAEQIDAVRDRELVSSGRNVERRDQAFGTGAGQTQSRLGLGAGTGQIMSEGNGPESSQAGPAMTSTQPVSGAFANRDRAKQKRRKKRIAGF